MRKLFASLALTLFALTTFAGMPYLDNTVRKIQVILAAAKTTSDLQWTACYQDQSSTYTLPLANTGTTNGLTAVDVIPAPAASTSRHIISFGLYNADTVPTTATVRLSDNGTYYTQWYGTLNVGDQLAYSEQRGFEVTDASGNFKTITGSATFSGLAFPGRLTPSSTQAVPTSDNVAVTSLYYLPDQRAVGYYVPVYNGSSFQGYSITSSGLTLTLNTSNHLSGKLYDVFAIVSSNTLTLATGPAWTSTSARSTTITQSIGNIWTNSTLMTAYNGATSYSVAANQGTYLGTFYASANGQTSVRFGMTAVAGGSHPLCYVWNAYNQVPGNFNIYDSNATWTYTTAVIRESDTASGQGGNQFDFIQGEVGLNVTGNYTAAVGNTNATGVFVAAFIGYDSTTAGATGGIDAQGYPMASTSRTNLSPVFSIKPTLGYHYIAQLEFSTATGTTTWYSVGNPYSTGSMIMFWY